MAIGLLTAGASATDENGSFAQDVADTVNGLITGATPIDAITLAGLPQTAGAPAGFGDLATVVTRGNPEPLLPNSQRIFLDGYTDITLPSPYSASAWLDLRQDIRDWLDARGVKAAWEAMTVQQRSVGVHPSLVSFKTPWFGFKYWCLYTPYPQSNSAFENPCLVASNDLVNWVVPNRIQNPIDQPSALTSDYMRDTHLYFDGENNRLCMMYLQRGSGFNRLYVKTFSGEILSERSEIWSGVVGTNDFASPSFWFNKTANKWQAIGHNLDNSPAWPIVKMESDNLESGWGAQTALTFPVYAGRKWWHSDFHLSDDAKTIFGLVQDNNGTGGASGNIYFCASNDFQNFSADLNYFSQAGQYRSCVIPNAGFLTSQLQSPMRLLTGGITPFNRGATASQSHINAITTPNSPNVIASDNFNRANSPTLGVSSSGTAWVNIDANTIGIVDNAASGVAGQSCRATLPAGKNSYTVSVVLKSVGTECNVYLRFVDANNCIRFRTHLRQLDQVVAGAVTLIKQLDCKPLTGASSAVVTLVVSPSNIKVLIDGVCYADVANSQHANATSAGLQISGATTSTVDSFAVTSDVI